MLIPVTLGGYVMGALSGMWGWDDIKKGGEYIDRIFPRYPSTDMFEIEIVWSELYLKEGLESYRPLLEEYQSYIERDCYVEDTVNSIVRCYFNPEEAKALTQEARWEQELLLTAFLQSLYAYSLYPLNTNNSLH